MRTYLAILAAASVLTPALASDPPQPKAAASASASAAASVPKMESSKPPLKEPAADAAKAASVPPAPKPTVSAPKPPPAASKDLDDKEAAAHREVAAKIAERLAAMRKDQRKVASHKPRSAKRHAKAAPASAGHGAHWSYEGESGPNSWGKLDPAWAKCAGGERQSPIDIRDGLKLDLDPVRFEYRPLRFSVLDNGHTIQVNPNGGGRMMVMGRTFDLIQFHFHRPAEEKVNGRGFPMVAHLVHQDADGKLAVVAVLMEEGKANELVQTVWNNLPLEKNEAASATVPLDVNELLPERREYFTFMGSLTTPPCTEGVLWIVLKEPVQVSAQQLAIFGRLYPMNARPVQARSGRLIKESN